MKRGGEGTKKGDGGMGSFEGGDRSEKGGVWEISNEQLLISAKTRGDGRN